MLMELGQHRGSGSCDPTSNRMELINPRFNQTR